MKFSLKKPIKYFYSVILLILTILYIPVLTIYTIIEFAMKPIESAMEWLKENI